MYKYQVGAGHVAAENVVAAVVALFHQALQTSLRRYVSHAVIDFTGAMVDFAAGADAVFVVITVLITPCWRKGGARRGRPSVDAAKSFGGVVAAFGDAVVRRINESGLRCVATAVVVSVVVVVVVVSALSLTWFRYFTKLMASGSMCELVDVVVVSFSLANIYSSQAAKVRDGRA